MTAQLERRSLTRFSSRDSRLILALGMVEGMLAVRTVHPGYALQAAARVHAVNVGELAMIVYEKLISCARARAWLEQIEADDAEQAAQPHGAQHP